MNAEVSFILSSWPESQFMNEKVKSDIFNCKPENEKSEIVAKVRNLLKLVFGHEIGGNQPASTELS